MNATHGPHDRAHDHSRRGNYGGHRGNRGDGHGRGWDSGSFGGPFDAFGGFPGAEALFSGGRGRRGGGHRRRARRGDVRHGILLLIAEESRNGYAIMQELAERSGGAWTPSSGAVYPALSQLEDEGLIEPDPGVGPKHYRLTEAGRTEVESLRGQRAPWEPEEEPQSRDNPMFGLMKSVKQAGMALQAVLSTGDEELIREAREEIDALRRRLYAKLASEDDDVEED